MSETWLKPHLYSDLVELRGFNSYRLDRKAGCGTKRGGGLITYVNDKYASACELLTELDISTENIEAQWLLIHRPQCKDMVICNIYRPPNGDLQKAISYLDDSIKAINVSKVNLFLLGDMNVNYKNKASPDFKKLNFFIRANGLTQHIQTTTRNTNKSKSLIDLAMSNSQFICETGTLEHFISDHQPIYVVHKKGRDKRKTVQFEGRSYRNYDKELFKAKLRDCDWDNLYQKNGPEEVWDVIHRNIIHVLDKMCPNRTFHIKNYRPEWMSKELIEQIKDRDYFYSKAKREGDEDSWNIARYLRNLTNSNIRQAKREFILDELKTHQDNSKKFWKVIKETIPTCRSKTKQDIILKVDGNEIGRDKVAHSINDFFINVGNVNKGAVPDRSPLEGMPPMNNNPLELPDENDEDRGQWGLRAVLQKDVFNVIKGINTSKSSGLDNVSSSIIKDAFSALLPEITFMYNLSINLSVFPKAWKEALVIPIPKSGNLTKVQNYRPISLLPLPGKILEKLIHSQLSGYIEENSLLDASQHGFRKGHSTIHSVAQLTNFISTKMDTKLATLVTYIDFRKAFDCVQHSVLLGKLQRLGLGHSVIKWIESYLTLRKQRVYANDTYSSFQTINQGVPQGSVLGPLFYIIYANDLVDVVKNCKVAMYADDTVLYTANKNFEKSVIEMQSDMSSLSFWCQNNGVDANTDKTMVMTFGSSKTLKSLPDFEIKFNNTPLLVTTSYKYLGMELDSQLNYNKHVSKIISSVSGKLKQFQRMRNFLDIRAATMVYKNMLLPIIEYGDIFLSSASVVNRKRLQTLQNRGLRCALNKGIETSSEDLHYEARLQKLEFRRDQHLLSFMYDQSKIPNLIKPKPKGSIKTRSHRKRLLKARRPKTEKFKRSLAYQGPTKWNSLPEPFHEARTKDIFKTLINKEVNLKFTCRSNFSTKCKLGTRSGSRRTPKRTSMIRAHKSLEKS